MRPTIFFAAMISLLATGAHAVQPITMDRDGVEEMVSRMRHGKAMDSLQRAADGACPPDTCFDGAPILRREGPLVILKEEKIGERAGRHRGGRHADHYIEPKVIYKQTVGIEDRKEYVANERTGGKIGGGLLGGLLGLLGFLGGPILGVGILAAGIVGGMKVGGDKAAKSAEQQPRVFDRTVEYDKY